jgi:hypothetical protein
MRDRLAAKLLAELYQAPEGYYVKIEMGYFKIIHVPRSKTSHHTHTHTYTYTNKCIIIR